MNDLQQKMSFVKAIDAMKSIERRTQIIDKKRFENDAEHTFHVAITAHILRDYAPPNCDIQKVILLLLYHDLVEIEAGDTFAYDVRGNKDKYERELAGAQKIFSLLPEKEGREAMDLWLEFERQETIESKFANVIDRLQPILLNIENNGGTWQENHLQIEAVEGRIRVIKEVSPELYAYIHPEIERIFKDISD